MATGDTLRQLVASHQTRNDEAFRAAVLRLIAEEQQRQHHALARELQRLLAVDSAANPGTQVSKHFQELPRNRERDSVLLEVRRPQRLLADAVLDDDTRQSLEDAISEYHRAELLNAYGLRPKNKLLFYGPPGCGKTMCAEVLASELGLPLLYTRFDGLVSSYLGETAANLRRVFEYASSGGWVLLFDEFDAVGKSRSDLGEQGELKRVVNSFLQMLDSFTSQNYFVAATNHESLLDSALWRRFDDVLYFGPPSETQASMFVTKKLAAFPHTHINPNRVARSTRGFSYADIELVCTEAIKRCILDGREALDTGTLTQTITRFRHRLRRVELAMQGSARHNGIPHESTSSVDAAES